MQATCTQGVDFFIGMSHWYDFMSTHIIGTLPNGTITHYGLRVESIQMQGMDGRVAWHLYSRMSKLEVKHTMSDDQSARQKSLKGSNQPSTERVQYQCPSDYVLCYLPLHYVL